MNSATVPVWLSTVNGTFASGAVDVMPGRTGPGCDGDTVITPSIPVPVLLGSGDDDVCAQQRPAKVRKAIKLNDWNIKSSTRPTRGLFKKCLSTESKFLPRQEAAAAVASASVGRNLSRKADRTAVTAAAAGT